MTGILRLYDRGGTTGTVVSHWGAKPSWAISAAGSFSAFMSAADARAYDLVGATSAGAVWISFAYPGLPTFGGICTAPKYADDETFELGAESFHVLIRKRVVPRTAKFHPAPAGAIATRALHSCQADDYAFITDVQADEDGDPVAVDPRGGDLYDDVMRQLVSASGQEWTVDADRVLSWRVRIGTDKTGTVKLYAPHEIVGFSYAGDLWTANNDIEGMAADQRYERSAHEFLSHTDSVKKIGRYQAVKRYPHVINKAMLRPLLRRDLKLSAWPAETADVTTVDVGRSWSRYVVGDSVSLCLPVAGIVKKVRILARSIDTDAGTERLTVDVENEQDGWAA